MSGNSAYSKPVHVFDAPEIGNIKAEFIYNFFTPNERIDETGYRQLIDKDSNFFKANGDANYRTINARVPRFVRLNIEYGLDPSLMASDQIERGERFVMSQRELTGAVANGLIVTEQTATSRLYTGYTSGNAGLDSELNNVMRLKLNKFFQNMKEQGLTPDQALTELSKKTNVEADTLAQLLPPNLNDVLGLNDAKHKPVSELMPDVASSSAKVQLLSTFAPLIQRRSVERGTSLLESGISNNYLNSIANLKADPKLLDAIGVPIPPSAGELEFQAPMIRPPRDATGNVLGTVAGVVGLLVEKTRVYNGKRYAMESIVVAGNSPELILDSKVAYGQIYEYRLRTLSLFEVPCTTPADAAGNPGQQFIGSFLVASSPTQSYRVEAIEDRAPPPPPVVDYYFNYTNDYEGSGVTLSWQFPTNPQRDIKYFQVFRRKSVKEPFELLCMVDFDNSIIRSLPKEEIDPSLVKSYPAPRNIFVDPEFTKESKFIYAVTSVDARMLSSPYSPQSQVSFDKHSNQIVVEHFADVGAPKQYPNWTAKAQFFVDSMKDSSHGKVSIYFDPEAYTLIDGDGNSSPLFQGLGDDRFAKYVFQFINTDRLAEQRFVVRIDNLDFKKKQEERKSKTSPKMNAAAQAINQKAKGKKGKGK